MNTPVQPNDVPALTSYRYTASGATFEVLLALVNELPYKTAKPIIDGMLGQLQQQELDAVQATNDAAQVAAQKEQELSDQKLAAQQEQALSDQKLAAMQAIKAISTDKLLTQEMPPATAETLPQN